MSANPKTNPDDTKHEAARRMAEAALEARQAGEEDRADLLMEQAEKTDPDAVSDVIPEQSGAGVPGTDIMPQDDEEIAAMSHTVEPGSAAPSRAGITGSGSGADGERR